MTVLAITDNIVQSQLTYYSNDDVEFVCDGARPLFPKVPVETETGAFLEILGGFGADHDPEDIKRALYGSAKELEVKYAQRNGWRVSTTALGARIDKEDASYKAGGVTRVDLRTDTMQAVVNNIKIGREILAASLISATVFAGYTEALSATATAPASIRLDNKKGDPIAFARDQRQKFRAQGGGSANALSVDIETAEILTEHPKLVEAYSRTQDSIGRMVDGMGDAADAILRSFLGRLFMVPADKVWIWRAQYNSANVEQTESLGYIAPKHVLLMRHEPAPRPRTPQSCLARFQYVGEGAKEGTVRRWDDGTNPDIERMDVSWQEQFGVPRPKLGRLVTTPIS